MSTKQVRHYSEIKDKITRAVDTITDPIRQTMGPRGGNVIFETDQGEVMLTNDGVTIAKNVSLEDPFENAVVNVIKESALKTNSQAGDGTSTTVLLSSILVKEGMKLIDGGTNWRDVTDQYSKFSTSLVEKLTKFKKEVKDDNNLFAIAKISANSDEQIAKDAVKIVRTAGEDGYIFTEPSNTKDTEIKEDTGFVYEPGMFAHEYVAIAPDGSSTFEDVPVLITDKQLYYPQEAETILNTCLTNGYKSVVIVAKDFVGEALPFFVANHQQGKIRVMLIKDANIEKTNNATLEDLAAYLGGEVISEKNGKIVDNLTIDNFCMAQKAHATKRMAVIMRYKHDPDDMLQVRVKTLKKELKKFGDSEGDEVSMLKKRLASLTNGIVTVRIGGNTPIEVKERRFRYEDAISAGRAAVMDGYLIGGGISIWNAYRSMKINKSVPLEMNSIFRKVAEANVAQIAENAGQHADNVITALMEFEEEHVYNALTGEYERVADTLIFDPFRVTKMAVENAVSIANAIISSRYLIVNHKKDEGEKE